MVRFKRPKGAQPGNQNALKHGFYSKVLDEAEQLDLEIAAGVTGIDGEIALLRVKIKALVDKDPDNLHLLIDATNTLARLLKTRYNLSKHESDGVKSAIGNVLMELAIPLGIAGIKGAL